MRGPLLEALGTQPRPRRGLVRVGLPTTLVAIAATATVLAIVPATSTPSALAVTRTPAWLELTVADATASPEKLNDELHKAGIPGEIRVIPVPPELVGKWATVLNHIEEPLQPGAVPQGRPDLDVGPSTIRIPIKDTRGTPWDFTFFLGRAAAPGEAYVYDGHWFPHGPFPEQHAG